VVSEFTANELMAFYQTPVHKIATVPEGVESRFRPVVDEGQLQMVRRRYDVSGPFILSVGVRRPHKNLGRLVAAFAALNGESDHQLVIVGAHDPRFPDEARTAAELHHLDGRVRFLDWVNERDLAALYTMADVLVMPSLVEGFGLPAVEAMACGTPVVVANNSSLSEVVGGAGVLVDPRDVVGMATSIRGLLRDKDRRVWLGRSGQHRAANFTWEKAARRILAVYQQAVKA
jgi:glycosyltransferase involved in cell wall biosynthesis